jgi:2-polyprenyl-3-methyl-5-hydroxy-6-metoxy-1,4-benzoquinol methylase
VKRHFQSLSKKAPWIEYVAVPVWLLISLKWRRLRYWILRNWLHNSIFVEQWEMGMCSHCPEPLLKFVLDRFKPASVLDFGCGTGKSLRYFIMQGLEAWGVEGSDKAISLSADRKQITRHNFERPLDLRRTFDLLWCFEVVEHIRPEKVDVLLDSMVRHSSLIVISAARPGQGGDGHFNEQPPEYWIHRMKARGYEVLSEETQILRRIPVTHAENMLVFKRLEAVKR